jgi:hypothetical protein
MLEGNHLVDLYPNWLLMAMKNPSACQMRSKLLSTGSDYNHGWRRVALCCIADWQSALLRLSETYESSTSCRIPFDDTAD